jgi:hypothetical protein
MGLALTVALSGSAALAADTAEEGVIDPKADAALHRMSDYLSGLQTVRFDSTTVDEKVTAEGQKIQELQDSKITVQRPNQIRVDRLGPRGHVFFRYDGKRFSIYNQDKNLYATAPAPANIDEAVDDMRDKLHVDAPGGDLLVADPYHALIEGMVTGRYIGLEPMGNVMAHHIAVTKKDVDWQIWIQDGPQALPLRYVITTKELPGHPQFTLETRDWRPNAPIEAASFAFTPPAGAKRVEFAPPRKVEH